MFRSSCSSWRHWAEPSHAVSCPQYSEKWWESRHHRLLWYVKDHRQSLSSLTMPDSDCLPELKGHPGVSITPLAASPKRLQTDNRLAFLALAPVKVVLQVWTLFSTLCYHTNPSKWMLVQNPPSIPTLIVCALVCRLRNTKLIIDWHNFGFSILALKLGDKHILVQVAKAYEQCLAKLACYHFAVTNAMCEVLKADYVGSGQVMALHDRPAPIFQPLSSSDRQDFLLHHTLTSTEAQAILSGRTRLLVSSTSWTADEDFSALLKALCSYSASATSDLPQLPEVLVIITGKGPHREHYLRQIDLLEQSQELEMVKIKTAWLSFEDYAKLLGAADLGVSLHTSSSGLDLPMKIVDMFGAGLPVLGFNNFVTWPELVQEGANGQGFTTAEEMAAKLKQLFDPSNQELEILKRGALKESNRRWDSEWNPIAGQLLGLAV